MELHDKTFKIPQRKLKMGEIWGIWVKYLSSHSQISPKDKIYPSLIKNATSQYESVVNILKFLSSLLNSVINIFVSFKQTYSLNIILVLL